MFFDRPDSGELAVLVHLSISQQSTQNDPREFEELVLSAGGDPVAFLSGQRNAPGPKYFLGSGKLEELCQLVRHHNAELVIFNHELSPSQERNLEKELQCRVLDRTGLILDIFAQRARTHEGKLQVELAQLQHMSTRLVRGWTHLERQKGGIGLRGPGETQLETDRRLLRARLKSIRARLERVRKQREQGRRSRTRAQVPTVSLIGYTNAGKSTLFNTVTGSDVYAEDQLFATLDPTMRRVQVGALGPVVMADTVGFISDLPHKLVEAFRATLEEASSSDLLLHIIDVADEERERNIREVNHVVSEIGADNIRQLLIYNKIDIMGEARPRIERDEHGMPMAIWLSAKENCGIELMYEAIAQLLTETTVHQTIRLAPQQGAIRARLYQQNAVLNEQFCDDGSCEIEICLPEIDWIKMLASEKISVDCIDIVGDDIAHKKRVV